ncbi:MAG: hypothetical protein CMJ45_01095 [Planctomyces sp.]|jgi:TorA maturation chaperone TorD|nr:hypothetical protein [Planctomyces sp.]MDP7274945.1 molecular chaperone TorD family protein [Planctomycetaceae bacterium]
MNNPNREDLEGLAGFYRLLSRLWVAEIDPEWFEALANGSLSEVAADLGLPVAGSAEEVIEQLATEYCRLMIGPQDHVPPHQSVWTEGQFQGHTAVSMQRYLEVVGEKVDSTMSDHIGVQLGVMSLMVDELASSLQDDTKRNSLKELVRSFFGEHVEWIQQFLVQAGKSTESEFYSRLIAVTGEFLAEERREWLTPS